MNPVLWRELRVTARQPRVAWMITLGLWFCVAVVWIVSDESNALLQGRGAGMLGRVLAGSLLMTLTVFIALVAPLLAMRGLARERRRQTYDVLIITPLTARDILRGKLLGSLLPLFLMLLATLPLTMVLRLYGGMGVFRVFVAYIYLALQVLVFGLIGHAVALVCDERERLSIFVLVIVLALVLVGTPIADAFMKSGFLWWLKLPFVAGFLMWLVSGVAQRFSPGADDFSGEGRYAILFLIIFLFLISGLIWDIGNGGPTLRYANPVLAMAWFTNLPAGAEPAQANFPVSFFLFFLLPGALFPVLANRLQLYFNTEAPDARGLFF